ncbi:glycosyltransferase family 87 protein [Microlunatus capsulatus]|uniref:Alpha-1,2-mannosyltransferase n=1 Tax=Microlunatus capsulatus TaxID=99117 RepID=A0ABS4ZD38_9ACTN|nr:glycosyltransferase family 87 protein [Microlunatus capsulatus]MBP2418695.1 alpha-1,2-mannosyltransferase [Microlunatus capsulatus]
MRPARPRTLAAAAWGLLVLLTAVLVQMALTLPAGPDGLSDLRVYQQAAGALVRGEGLYAFRAANGDGFSYPPVAALLLAPLAGLPPAALGVLWTLALVGLTVLLAHLVLLRGDHPVLRRPPPAAALPLSACVLLASYPVFSGVFLGQVSLLVTVLALLDALDVVPRRLQGVATGLAAAVKLTPLVFLPHLWLTGRRRAAVVAAATFVVAGAAAWLVRPADSGLYWSTALEVPAFIPLEQLDNQSLRGLAARAGRTGPAAGALVLLASALLAGLALLRARALHRQGRRLAAAVVVGALAVVASPVSWSHHQTALVLAAGCAVAGPARWVRTWPVLVLVLMTLPLPFLLPLLPGAVRPVADELVLLLALAVALGLPFRRRRPPVASPAPAVASSEARTPARR